MRRVDGPRQAQQSERRARDGEGGRVDGEHPARPDAGDEHPGDRRPGHASDALRDRLISALACCRRSARTVSGTSPVEAGEKKASPAPKSGEEDEQLPELRAPGDQQHRDERLRAGAQQVGAEHHALPRQPVGDDAAEEQEHDARDEAAASTSPSAEAEPVSSMTAKASATGTRLVPSAEVACPSQRSLNSRSSSAPSLAATSIS